MRNSYFSVIFFLVLSACGGGGGGGDGSAGLNSNVTTGDYFNYSYTSKSSAGTQTAYTFTRFMSDVKPDQSFVTDYTYSNDFQKSTYETNNNFQEINWNSATTSCSNSPITTSPGSVKNLKVGTTWDLKYNRTCITSNTSTIYNTTNKGSVVASEPFVIGAITFDTYKLVYTIDQSTTTNRNITNYICWRDKTFDRTLACDSTYANYPNGAMVTTAANSGSTSFKLNSFSVTGFTSNKPSVARFAGKWVLNWSGDSFGNCAITANVVGVIVGTCTQQTPYVTTGSITGNVDLNGNLNITGEIGSTISGNLTSPISGSGTWKNTTSNGVWVASHL
jgi:hypothetical protein